MAEAGEKVVGFMIYELHKSKLHILNFADTMVMLPGIFPYYITGAITASGGSWNASIVAEVASWGDTHLTA